MQVKNVLPIQGCSAEENNTTEPKSKQIENLKFHLVLCGVMLSLPFFFESQMLKFMDITTLSDFAIAVLNLSTNIGGFVGALMIGIGLRMCLFSK